MTATKSIKEILLENVGRYCDCTNKDGEEVSGVIKSAGTEVWISIGHNGEITLDSKDVISIENIEDL